MARSRRSALLRTFAIVLLVWVGLDLGAHGLAPHDLVPITAGDSVDRLSPDTGMVAPGHPHDHCFSHGTYLGAFPTPDLAGLVPSGSADPVGPTDVPGRVPHPLDKPPQSRA